MEKRAMELSIGIDVGTTGVRAMAASLDGEMVAAVQCDFPAGTTRCEGPTVEQSPHVWTETVWHVLHQLGAILLREKPIPEVVGIAVDATSGTFLLLDHAHSPITPGILYSDLRAADLCAEAQNALRDVLQPYGIGIAPAFALCKLLFIKRNNPELIDRCRSVVHQTDYIVGMLTGCFEVTDVSSALKTGVNPGTLEWPAEIEHTLGLPLDRFPRVRPSGEVIGYLTDAAAGQSGLPRGIPVVSGCTDGTAAAVASGIKAPGDLNVTLGTTLVFKGGSESPLVDTGERIYNHRHPDGGYLPGAASSAGAGWVRTATSDVSLPHLEAQAAERIPTGRYVYPLETEGERFPFSCPTAKGFGLTEITDVAERFAAGMEGIAYLERMGIGVLESLGLLRTNATHATGGATKNDLWLRIRAAVSRRSMLVPQNPASAFGSAILAGAPRLGSCRDAQNQMVRVRHCVDPDERLALAYDEGYVAFRDALAQRGYR